LINPASSHQRVRVSAHRGIAVDGRTNTLAAFERAIAAGADMIELDVRRVQDELVIFHDPLSGGVPLSERTYEQLQAGEGSAVPTLREALTLCRGRIAVNIELKESGYEALVVSAVHEQGEPAKTIISSFIDQVIKQSKAIDPTLATGLVLGRRRPSAPLRTRFSELFPGDRLLAARADYAIVHVILARLGVLARVSKAGIPAMVWTVNSAAALRRYAGDSRVRVIITDEIGLARGIIG
jgi:glycerophosphoryl diester phosphodiesterase